MFFFRVAPSPACSPPHSSTLQSRVATFTGHNGGVVSSLASSENGYSLASGGSDGSVLCWDLRKLVVVHTLPLGAPVRSLAYDPSAQFLAGGGASGVVTVWDAGKGDTTPVGSWPSLQRGAVVGLAWGPGHLASVGSEGGMVVLGSG